MLVDFQHAPRSAGRSVGRPVGRSIDHACAGVIQSMYNRLTRPQTPINPTLTGQPESVSQAGPSILSINQPSGNEPTGPTAAPALKQQRGGWESRGRRAQPRAAAVVLCTCVVGIGVVGCVKSYGMTGVSRTPLSCLPDPPPIIIMQIRTPRSTPRPRPPPPPRRPAPLPRCVREKVMLCVIQFRPLNPTSTYIRTHTAHQR